MSKVTRALISVSDKAGVVELARELSAMGVEILSTGGTAKAMRDGGVKVKDVSEFTGFPEMMDGRVKTLHPKVHGGLLSRRGNASDVREMQEHGLQYIDMVIVNLYPFEQTILKPGVTYEDAIENIDIGGPTMLRAAAKNHRDVAVVVDPADYAGILEEMRAAGEVSAATKARLARKVFMHTSRYDATIAAYLAEQQGVADSFPSTYTTTYKLVDMLPYGENPHQRAAAYSELPGGLNVFSASKLQGTELSFNDYGNASVAMLLLREFEKPVCTLVKHSNPCGVATGAAAEAFARAHATDSTSAYRSVAAFNCPVDAEAARLVCEQQIEMVMAPDYSDGAMEAFASKMNMKVLRLPDLMSAALRGFDIRRVAGGLLVQDWDTKIMESAEFQVVSRRKPTKQELDAMEFAWRVCKHVTSKAVVYAHADRTVGIGVGQLSRVYAARAGAINAAQSLKDTAVASDGVITNVDSIEGIKRAGATAIIQPGGSAMDPEIIEAANSHDMVMVFTGMRHFKH